MDIKLALKPMQQNSELQAALESAAERAIQSAAAEFKDSDVSNLVDARLARPADEEEIQKLFEKYPMQMPGFQLVYDRTPDFFALLKCRGQASVAVTGSFKGEKELLGIGAISIREGYIAGARVRVAYLGDLRVIPHRKTFRLWRAIYARLVEVISQELGVETFLTAILGENTLAIRSLVERRNSDFLYESVGQMRMINILSSFATLPEDSRIRQHGLTVHFGDDVAYHEFANQNAPSMRHGYVQPWESGFPMVVRNASAEVVMALKMVSPDPFKRMRVVNASLAVRGMMSLARVAGNGELSTAYLAGIVYKPGASPLVRRLALMAAIEGCYRDPVRGILKTKTMLVVPDAVGLSFRDLRGRATSIAPVQLFEVVSKNSTPTFGGHQSSSAQDLGFDMALV